MTEEQLELDVEVEEAAPVKKGPRKRGPVRVARLSNPGALNTNPQLLALFEAAYDADPLASPFDEMLPEIQNAIQNPQSGFLVCAEGGQFVGLTIINLPTSKSCPIPVVSMFYAKGTRPAKAALLDAGVDFMVQNGYTQFAAINGTDTRDDAWTRSFKNAGKARRVGSIFRFYIGE